MALERPQLSEQLTVVETPTSPSSDLALSRFEFETGKGNEGTKILMLEWDASVFGVKSSTTTDTGELETTRNEEKKKGGGTSGSDWDISWDGKGDVLPVRDTEPDPPNANTRRLYFLLPPGSTVPALVTIAPKSDVPNNTILRTKPLPAIYPAELGGAREAAGRRGVLHTIWAKMRLAELQAEIAKEMKENGESVGLEMAMQERQRIVDHFGLAPGQDIPKPTRLHIPLNVVGPASPRSPIGGKLGEKLRGLKLATSPAELAAAATQASKSAHPRTQSLITNLPPNPSSALPSLGTRLLPQQDPGTGGGLASLDAIVGSGIHRGASTKKNESGGGGGGGGAGDDATEEDLFALPMSPRSPEMKRSPFSLL